jgi:hypothetical protein
MKKMMLLMLTLLIWGAASMNAQVTIGADRVPAPDAVLDLDGTQGALLLPRVDALAQITDPLPGMQVFLVPKNAIYFYRGDRWSALATAAYDNHSFHVEVGTVTIPANSTSGSTAITAPYEYRAICGLMGVAGYVWIGWSSELKSAAVYVQLPTSSTTARDVAFRCLNLSDTY